MQPIQTKATSIANDLDAIRANLARVKQLIADLEKEIANRSRLN